MAKKDHYPPEERAAITRVAEAIQQALTDTGWSAEGVLVKAACVAHYLDTDGDHQIIRFGVTLDGLEPAGWDTRGLMFDALFMHEPGYEEDDE